MDELQAVYAPLSTDLVSMLDEQAITLRKSRVPIAPSMRTHGPRVSACMASSGKRPLSVRDI